MRLIAPTLLLSSLVLAPTFSGCTVDLKDNGDGDGDGAGDGDGTGDGDGLNTGGNLITGGSSTGGALGTGGSGTGGANTGGALGTGGAVGAGGSASGGESSGGQTGTGGSESTGSDGCGMNTGQQTNSWVASNLGPTVNNRSYDVRLPSGYDPDRPYPVVLLLHGCSSATNNVPMENQTGTDAIVVRGAGSADNFCWNDSATGPDVAYIDALLEDVQDRFCVDTDAIFGVGYSSGGWIGNRLTCIRGDVFRGFGTVAGGEPGSISGCGGQVARIFINDNNDNDNQIAWSVPARDRQIAANGCTNTSMSVNPSPCVEYQGCDPGYPVVWCATSGQGHSRQDGLAAPAFWNFFQSLMD